MPFYGFKPNPKQQVINKAKNLFGRDAKVVITGMRIKSPLAAKQLDIPNGVYYVECFVNGQHRGSAHMRNWRKAYNLLVIEVEKSYERSLSASPGAV